MIEYQYHLLALKTVNERIMRQHAKDADGKERKILKKCLNTLTLTVVYLEKLAHIGLISNSSEEILLFFGHWMNKYRKKMPDLNW